MYKLFKRLLLFVFIIFIPTFFASFFSCLFISLFITSGFSDYAPNNWNHTFSATIPLYKAYMMYLWKFLVLKAVSVDIYLYVLKGYKRSELLFYGLKTFFIFIILYFGTLLYLGDSFGIFQYYHLENLPHYAYAVLFCMGILFSIVCVFSVHLLHKKWIFPDYQLK